MLEFNLDEKDSVLTVRPKSALEESDFENLAKAVDPYIAKTGDLRGIIVDAPEFPGWKSFKDMVVHLRFVRDHHKHVKKVAIVTSSRFGGVAEALGAHFVSAEIRNFSPSELSAAKQWITGSV